MELQPKAFIDSPVSSAISSNLLKMEGWYASDANALVEICINGIELDYVHWIERPDVSEAHPQHHCRGWMVWADVGQFRNLNRRGVTLSVRVDGRIVSSKVIRPVWQGDTTEQLLYYFLHVPKCAGTSIASSLEGALDKAFFRVYEDHPQYPCYEQFCEFSSATTSKVEVIFGHYSFGMHRDRIDPRPYKYVAMVREPANYLLSQFLFQKFNCLNPEFAEYKDPYEMLEKCSRSDMDNVFCRQLSGAFRYNKPVTRRHLELAKKNIDDHFEFVGIAEKIEASAKTISEIFGVNIGRPPVENVSQNKELIDDINTSTFRNAARQRIVYDEELYEYVKEKYWS